MSMPTHPGASASFASLNLVEPLLRALAAKKYTEPSPIQARAIPHVLDGRDLLGCAQTGTGKTAAFALPILQRLSADTVARTPGRPRALVLTPTRELAVQIDESFHTYGRHVRLRHAVVFGGVSQMHQVRALAAGVDILVATPGRLLDLMQQRHVHLDRVEIFVLDEADRMLDMGFAPDVKRIMATLPSPRQSLLFSATMPDSIRELANRLLRNPVHVAVTPVSSTVERIDQRVCHVGRDQKHRLLVHLLGEHPEGLVLVFSKTKHGANRLADRLDREGIRAAAIHGNKSQGARQRALEDFRAGRARVLVATDIAARGIDVKGISVVVNFDLPLEPEAYVHRIGRTARAGADGRAYSLCDPTERGSLRAIERIIRQAIPVHADHPFRGAGDPADGGRRSPARGVGYGPRARGPQPQPVSSKTDRSGADRPTRRRRGRKFSGHSAAGGVARDGVAAAPVAGAQSAGPKGRSRWSSPFRFRR